MKAILFKIVIFLALITTASKCGGGEDNSLIMRGFERTMTVVQIDSLCRADTLALDLEDWICAEFVDYETGNVVKKYSYIKELTDTTEIMYIITQKDSTYKVLKRIVE